MFCGFSFFEPGCQLNHPDPKVGIVNVEVVGDTPHNNEVDLVVKMMGELFEKKPLRGKEENIQKMMKLTPCSSSSQAKVPEVPVKLVSLLFTCRW